MLGSGASGQVFPEQLRKIDSLRADLRHANAPIARAALHYRISMIYGQQMVDSSSRHGERAISILDRAGIPLVDVIRSGRIPMNAYLVEFLFDQGKLFTSMRYAYRFERVFREMKDTANLIKLHFLMGANLLHQGAWKNAMVYFRDNLKANHGHGVDRVSAFAHMDLGKCFIALGKPDSSIAHSEEALRLMHRYGILTWGPTENNLGKAYRLRGDTILAGYYHRLAAKTVLAERPICHYSAEVLNGLAEFHRWEGDPDSAIYSARLALDLARRIPLIGDQERAAGILASVFEHKGELDSAFRYQKLRLALMDSIETKARLIDARNLSAQVAMQADSLAYARKLAMKAEEVRQQRKMRNGLFGGLALVALFAGIFFFQRNHISKEKKHSEGLLLNILPEEVADELKAKGEAKAVQFDQVSVLFTDFKGFTAMSEQMSAQQLVMDLHECFSAFDRICERHNIEKIKTIGDAYMAAGGLPVPNATHATDCIQAALEMRDFIAEGKARKVAAGLPFFEIRIGVHTGPVVAGIVGVKKFQYDIWGDTVNTASRMESSGEAGRVNMSHTTYDEAKDVAGLDFTPRGQVMAKGKGEMEMYFVDRS